MRDERRDPIGANAVDSERAQPIPFGGLVTRPRDDSAIHPVNCRDERFINELAGFPEIAGVGCPKN